MKIPFTKMHGLGNDFIVLNAIEHQIELGEKRIAKWSDRHTGIGFDQCLVIEPGREAGIDFYYRIFNSDGTEVGQCGNGARCLARYLQTYGLTTKSEITVATPTAKMRLILNADDSVSVEMPVPDFHPAAVPTKLKSKQEIYTLEVLGQTVSFHALNIGNPHAILAVKELAKAPVATLGAALSQHSSFPEEANIGFMQLSLQNEILLRVYERGCGETMACGSGAVAAAIVARRFYGLLDPVQVHLPGGSLLVSWPTVNSAPLLCGPAEFVFEGTITL